ncbi:MAG: twin-arginine translocase subunit TatC [Deltaproteobacteria bacterium]|nr:twin-arginine translocase subunit TatC [Deltaproteobacteria bacterium]
MFARWGEKIQEMDREQFFGKLEGLRRALIHIFLAVGALSVVSFFFWKETLSFLQQPLGLPLIMYSLPEAFLTSLRLSFFLGIFFSAPFIFKALWGAFAPLLALSSRRSSFLVVLSASILFYGGCLFCYLLVLPVGIRFLVAYGSENLQPMIGLSKYLSFTVGLTLAFGAVFELPLVLMVLGRVGLIGHRALARNRKYALMLNAVLSALLTPTPDAYTMLLMMVPIQALYELSIWLVRLFGKGKIPAPEPA